MPEDKKKAFSLDSLIEAVNKTGGISVDQLAVGDVVKVRTLNTVYTFLIKNPAERLAEATSNGRHITARTEVFIEGSKANQWTSMIASGQIIVGLFLEIYINDESIPQDQRILWLSQTKSISVNGCTLMPPQNNKVN